MTADHALIQLLKLEPLNLDNIIKYTGWTHEKTSETIEKCKASGAIERRCSKNQFGYKYAVVTVPAVRKVRMVKRTVECVQPKMFSLRDTNMQKHALDENQRGRAGRANRGEYIGLGQVWNAGSRTATVGEGVA